MTTMAESWVILKTKVRLTQPAKLAAGGCSPLEPRLSEYLSLTIHTAGCPSKGAG